jgi:hypothetical protein
MANIDASFGLRPVRRRNGASYHVATTPYYIPSSYGTALYIGDPVVKTGTSNTAAVTVPGAGNFAPGELAEINKATAGDGNMLTGVIVGFAALPTDLSKIYNPASTARVAYVADDPDMIFEIQADGAIAATEIGLNAVLIYTNAGSTTTGLSGVELDTSSDAPAADASNQLTILRVADAPGRNELGSAWTVVEVRINQHTEMTGQIGV